AASSRRVARSTRRSPSSRMRCGWATTSASASDETPRPPGPRPRARCGCVGPRGEHRRRRRHRDDGVRPGAVGGVLHRCPRLRAGGGRGGTGRRVRAPVRRVPRAAARGAPAPRARGDRADRVRDAARTARARGRPKQRSLVPAHRDRGVRHGCGLPALATTPDRTRLPRAAAPARLEPAGRGHPGLLLPRSRRSPARAHLVSAGQGRCSLARARVAALPRHRSHRDRHARHRDEPRLLSRPPRDAGRRGEPQQRPRAGATERGARRAAAHHGSPCGTRAGHRAPPVPRPADRTPVPGRRAPERSDPLADPALRRRCGRARCARAAGGVARCPARLRPRRVAAGPRRTLPGGRHTMKDAESARLEEDGARARNWKRWGPYLAERQWGTVREDYSADGACWGYFPHDHARSRAYRWGEDGLLGLTDREGRFCCAGALWTGRDPILKERLFGLTGPEGNHGEDVKECYFYLDSTPTHSYLKALYKYPQAEFPYARLVEENRRRGKGDCE